MRVALVTLVWLIVSTTAIASAHELPRDAVENAQFQQRLGADVPLDIPFRDENGAEVTLGDYFTNQRPVILSLNYFHCQYVCPIEEDGLINGLNGVRLTLGKDFNLITVSFDPNDVPLDASQVKARGLRGYDRPQAGDAWHVLTGDQASIDQLTSAVGFQDIYDRQQNDFAHPVGVVVLTPGGQISRYIYGLDFSSNDLQLALIDAAADQIGSLLDRAMLICYQYDPLTGRYTPFALNLMRIGGALAVVALGVVLTRLWRADLGSRPKH